MDLIGCGSITDDIIARLPPTLRALNVSKCWELTQSVSFMHLPALESLDCSDTNAVTAGVAHLPPSLRELRMHHHRRLPWPADFSHLCNLRVVKCKRSSVFSSASATSLPPSLEVLDFGSEYCDTTHNPWPRGWSLAHMSRLRVLCASRASIDSAAIAMLPPTLRVLDLQDCCMLASASFAHLTCLHTLNLNDVHNISAAALASLPPSLVSLDLCEMSFRQMLSPRTVFPHLPALRVLNVSCTEIGDKAVASMPAGLEELYMMRCAKVTQRASLDTPGAAVY